LFEKVIQWKEEVCCGVWWSLLLDRLLEVHFWISLIFLFWNNLQESCCFRINLGLVIFFNQFPGWRARSFSSYTSINLQMITGRDQYLSRSWSCQVWVWPTDVGWKVDLGFVVGLVELGKNKKFEKEIWSRIATQILASQPIRFNPWDQIKRTKFHRETIFFNQFIIKFNNSIHGYT